MQLSCGGVEIEALGTFKAAKLYPRGGRAWDWRETGTRQVPGIQPADVAELLAQGGAEVVLSQGVLKCLHVCPETLALLEHRGVHARPGNRGGRPPVQRARGGAQGRRRVPLAC